MVVLSIVFGILSILTGCFCIGGLFGILGVGFSISSFNRVGRNKLNTFGLVTCIIGIILSLIMFIYILSMPDEYSNVKSTTEATTEATTKATTETTTEITTEEKASTESADSPSTENTDTLSVDSVDIENILSTLFNSNIDDSYKTSSYYCDILTPAKGDGKLVSIQMESDAFKDENVCASLVVDIIASIYMSDDYEYVNSVEFYMLSSGQLNYLISLKNAQNVSTVSDITPNLEITSYNDANDAAEVQATDTEPQVWIPSSGSKYHSKSSCSNMNNPRQVSKSEAENMGYTPCKRCY